MLDYTVAGPAPAPDNSLRTLIRDVRQLPQYLSQPDDGAKLMPISGRRASWMLGRDHGRLQGMELQKLGCPSGLARQELVAPQQVFV